MYDILANEDYGPLWILAPFWFVSAHICWRLGKTPQPTGPFFYWMISSLVGSLLYPAIMASWPVIAANQPLGHIVLLTVYLLIGGFLGWWSLGRARDAGIKSAWLASFAWFPLAALFLIFAKPQPARKAKPYGLLKTVGGIVLTVFVAYTINIAAILFLQEKAHYARLSILGYPKEQAIREYAQFSSEAAPMRLDENTVWDGFTSRGEALVAEYTMSDGVIGDPLWVYTRLASGPATLACDNEMYRDLRNLGYGLELDYRQSDGGTFASFRIDDGLCAELAEGAIGNIVPEDIIDASLHADGAEILAIIADGLPEEKTAIHRTIRKSLNGQVESLSPAIRSLLSDIRHRHVNAVTKASDGSLKDYIGAYLAITEALSDDPAACLGFFRSGGAGAGEVFNQPEFQEHLFEAARVMVRLFQEGEAGDIIRRPPTETDWEPVFLNMEALGVTEAGFQALADQSLVTPEGCAAVIALYRTLQHGDSPEVGRVRAAIAGELIKS
ncbi:hypothetical protein ACEUZ9_000302 [Paracoccus litorisediminis]|uniref:hypothetical protein n=1 Tax=Paracoccus litorisediminis TaxID=2006130 RepID=UPI0037344FBB